MKKQTRFLEIGVKAEVEGKEVPLGELHPEDKATLMHGMADPKVMEALGYFHEVPVLCIGWNGLLRLWNVNTQVGERRYDATEPKLIVALRKLYAQLLRDGHIHKEDKRNETHTGFAGHPDSQRDNVRGGEW